MKPMPKAGFLSSYVALVLSMCPAIVEAAFPYPPLCTCTVTITQFPPRPACIASFEPDVVRLTPAGSTATPAADQAMVTVRVRDANNTVIANAIVELVEEAGTVNIADGGAPWAETDPFGLATVFLSGASGSGRIVLCADGVPLCRLSVRSPDVAKGATPELCGIGTGASAVNGSDINNPVCGFLAKFGAVTPGINDGWDLNCDENVNGSDVIGILGKGGVLQYFGDTGTLGAKNACSL